MSSILLNHSTEVGNIMYIQVSQSDSDLASNKVDVYLDDRLLGAVGPGQSIAGKCDKGNVTVRCGLYSATYTAVEDMRLRIQWVIEPNGMKLEKEK